MTLKICKASFAMVMINYYVIYTIRGSYISHGTVLFTMLTLFFLLYDMGSSGGYIYIPKEIKSLILFFIWILITAPFAISRGTAISGCIDFAQKLIYLITVFYICYKDGSIQFPAKLFFVIAIITSFVILLRGINFGVRLELSGNVSENAYGNLLVFGVFCAGEVCA